MCYQWRIRNCEGPDVCELRPLYISDIKETCHRQSLLYSPKFEERKRRMGKRYFCIYNVSLNCPTESVVIRSSPANTNWPNTEDYNNYVAFYANQSERYPMDTFRGEKTYRRTLDSSSFFAILWTDNTNEKRSFELIAECSKEEGSGNVDILSDNYLQK